MGLFVGLSVAADNWWSERRARMDQIIELRAEATLCCSRQDRIEEVVLWRAEVLQFNSALSMLEVKK